MNYNDPEEFITGCFTIAIVILIILAGLIFGSTAIYKHNTKNKRRWRIQCFQFKRIFNQ